MKMRRTERRGMKMGRKKKMAMRGGGADQWQEAASHAIHSPLQKDSEALQHHTGMRVGRTACPCLSLCLPLPLCPCHCHPCPRALVPPLPLLPDRLLECPRLTS